MRASPVVSGWLSNNAIGVMPDHMHSRQDEDGLQSIGGVLRSGFLQARGGAAAILCRCQCVGMCYVGIGACSEPLL